MTLNLNDLDTLSHLDVFYPLVVVHEGIYQRESVAS